MARLILTDGGFPTCAGCGAQFTEFLPYFLDSRIGTRNAYIPKAWDRIGTSAPDIQAFARQHADCPAAMYAPTKEGTGNSSWTPN